MLCDFENISALDYRCIRRGCGRIVTNVQVHELPIKASCSAPRGVGDWVALYIARVMGVVQVKRCGCVWRQRSLNTAGWWVTDTITSAIRNP